MAFETQPKQGFEAGSVLEDGVKLARGPSKTEQKRLQEEERVALEEERVYRKGVSSI